MKIIIPKVENVNTVINKIQEFINKNYKDYPILDSELSLSINLTHKNNQICPDNKLAFKILNTEEDFKIENLLETVKNTAVLNAIEALIMKKA